MSRVYHPYDTLYPEVHAFVHRRAIDRYKHFVVYIVQDEERNSDKLEDREDRR